MMGWKTVLYKIVTFILSDLASIFNTLFLVDRISYPIKTHICCLQFSLENYPFEFPTVVEFLVWIDVRGCIYYNSIKMVRITTIYLTRLNSTMVLVSAVCTMIFLMMRCIMNTSSFHLETFCRCVVRVRETFLK